LGNLFSSYFFLTNRHACDLYFAGCKRGGAGLFRFNDRALKSACIHVATQPSPVPPHELGYPRPLRLLYRLCLFPVRLAAILPESQFQNFAVYYCKFLELLKAPVKQALEKANK